MTGVCGHTYGNHNVWSMTREPSSYFPFTWSEALAHPGAEQMHLVKELRLSHDYFSFRHAPELLAENYPGMGHLSAGRGDDYAYIYTPLGLPVSVNLGELSGSNCLRAKWFHCKSGETTVFSILPSRGQSILVPPTQGKGCDWVLIIEQA